MSELRHPYHIGSTYFVHTKSSSAPTCSQVATILFPGTDHDAAFQRLLIDKLLPMASDGDFSRFNFPPWRDKRSHALLSSLVAVVRHLHG